MQQLLQFIQRHGAGDPWFHNDNHRDAYFQEFTRYVKGIIWGLRNPGMPAWRKKDVLEYLANFYGCNAVKMNTVKGQAESVLLGVEYKMLQYVLDFKEQDVFIGHYHPLFHQTTRVLNHIRREVGVEFGLDAHPLNINDPQRIALGTRAQYQMIFQQRFHPASLIEGVRRKLELEPDRGWQRDIPKWVHAIIDKLETDGNINADEADRRRDDYFTFTQKLTAEGTAFLLLNMGANSPLRTV